MPDLATVLTPISANLIAERLSYADTSPEYNAPLLATTKRLFVDAEFAPVKHEAIIGEMTAKAKVIESKPKATRQEVRSIGLPAAQSHWRIAGRPIICFEKPASDEILRTAFSCDH